MSAFCHVVHGALFTLGHSTCDGGVGDALLDCVNVVVAAAGHGDCSTHQNEVSRGALQWTQSSDSTC